MAADKKPVKSNKDTVYVDVDDEITHIIDKVKSSDKKIVALVLPKRASVLQSIVNMKLLKRAAQGSKKSIVLITSETGLLPLAGAAGLHVAKSLQSKPEIPPTPEQTADTFEAEEIKDEGVADTLDKTASIGALSDAYKASKMDSDDEVVELDNVKPEPLTKGKPKKKRHLKVPNFERFRLGLVLAGLGVVLFVVGWILAVFVLPRATITIKTDTTSVVSAFDFTVSTNQAELDLEAKKIPAVIKEVKKTDTEKVPATGERDDGTKARGTVTLSVPCTAGDETVVAAGTAVSSGGNNYITQTNAKLDDHVPGCRFTKNVNVVAAENGEKYNLDSGQVFTVAGHSNVSARNGSAIDGGTSKIVKIVTQKDIDDAVDKIQIRQSAGASDEVEALLVAEGLHPVRQTLKSTEPKIESTPKADTEGDEVTVTSEVTYTMLGINRSDLSSIIAADIEDEIDTEKQVILQDGIDKAILRINNNPEPNEAYLNFRTSVVAGPDIDEEGLKEIVRGKKRGEIEQYVSGLPGVRDVLVEYSPFWVYQTPKAANKINVVIEKPQLEQPAESNGQ